MKRLMIAFGLVALAAAPASGQVRTGISVEPYLGYGFFGGLPGTNATLEADVAYGARVSYQFAPQWGVFANAHRSTPEVTGPAPSGLQVTNGQLNVDHWSAGVEFSYVPRGGAEGMLPILLEAGMGQARYAGGTNDLAANIGIASALRLSPNFAIRYGANDYISNYSGGDGVIHQIFVRLGGEISF